MSYLEKNNLVILDTTDLKEILKATIKEEIKELEERLRKPSRILSRVQAATQIGVSPNTISNYVHSGRIPNHGKGRKILIMEHELVNSAAMHKRFNYSSI